LLKKSLWGAALVAVASFGLLLTPGTSWAQRHGGGVGHGGGGWHGDGGGWHGGDWHGDGHGGWGNGFVWGLGLGYGLGAWPDYGYGGYYSSPYYYSSDYYYTPTYTYAAPGTTYYQQPGYVVSPDTTGGYYGNYTAQPATQNAADFTVRVPDPNAQVWFGNFQTQQRGAVREFESASLQPGQSYTFHIRARWMQNGQPVEQTRDVTAAAGQHVNVQFNNTANQFNNNVPASNVLPATSNQAPVNTVPPATNPRPATSTVPPATNNRPATNTVPASNPGQP
jgi:uncharacterized protein (TIGR03000 family)